MKKIEKRGVMATDYKIDTAQVLRYLGAKPDAATEKLIYDCAARLMTEARPKYIWKEFGLDGLKIEGSAAALDGKTAAERLVGCTSCALLGATLGIEADMLIRRAQSTDMARAVVYDACATDLVEKVCDCAQEEIKVYAESKGLFITDRFSPGYGDLALEFQKDLCAVLDTSRNLGVYLTDSLLLTPTKSVTAIVGIGKTECRAERGCNSCNMAERCRFKSVGNSQCGVRK